MARHDHIHHGGTAHNSPPADLRICPGCASDLVQPIEWGRVDGQRWRLELRCPECRLSTIGVYDQRTVDQYDALLEDAAECLVDELAELERRNMEAQIEIFADALRRDLIVADDFA